MAQITFRGNLSAASFPLVSDFMGQTVVIGQYDQNFQRRKQFSGEDSDLDIGVPQVYYCHNVMPVGQGFKSIAYKMVVRPHAGIFNFKRVFLAKDPAERKAIVGITESGGIFMYTSGDNSWTNVTSATGGWQGGVFSVANANGYTYLCLSRFNVFKVDVENKTINAVAFAGLIMSGIVGICASSNYLIAHDDITVYWSSALDPEDFVPSLITGAGSGVPQDINGQIVCILPLGSGFAVYTTTNIILAAYSGNLRFPWIFKPAANSAGILKAEHVAHDGDSGSNYAWTSSGLLKVAPSGCTPVHPEVTDFLSGRIFEDFNEDTNVFSSQYLQDQMSVEVAYVSSRYLILSYGVNDSDIGELSYALVYDSAFKRWGKLKINHVACFELSTDSEEDLTFEQLDDTVYNDYENIAFNELTTLSDLSSEAKRTIAFLQKDGTIRLAIWDYGDTSAEGVLVLGKYQLRRGGVCTFQELVLENVEQDNTNFSTTLETTIDGKNLYASMAPTQVLNNGKLRKYNSLQTGLNHSIIVKGAFNLVSMILSLTSAGRM